jgi:hypothetical protein
VVVKYFAGLLAAVALVCGATVAGYNYYEHAVDTRSGGGGGGGDDGGVIAAGDTTSVPTSLPNTDQVIVTGTIAHFHAEGARLESVPMPLTITTPQRGEGAGASIQNVQVDGEATDIEWDAGTPLALAGDGGALVTGPCTVDADPTNTTLGLGATPHGFVPGTYTVTSSVAIGTGSLARPADQATMVATDQSAITFRGDATTTFGTVALSLVGTGAVTIQGDLLIVRPDGSQQKITSVTFPSGQFKAKLNPSATGPQVSATLQGAVTTG